ncbi:hypothetical protein LNQ82_05720 [Conchiformibius steedae DSM 2580]|uniref:Uncharacterized protein n=1 Tax=Conchiformibius steedae DSM 2580 TaxID=1121352 RepID=A0AAE9HRC9_9NEIS|nr:hypothetical protein [Conchiformibius steedae]QMT33966.1 hypothetical protein H3L98_02800 [Conchiformibius steedae]URD66734.1 hypothetical protein LNQ82_05720 [Conchiformibius steedae DSM 2580]
MKNELRLAIQALAQPSNIQKKLVQNSPIVGEELILYYSDAIESYFESDHLDMSASQNIALKQLDDFILSKSGHEYQDIWLNPEKLDGSEWQHIRYLATIVAKEFNWTLESPQPLYTIIISI